LAGEFGFLASEIDKKSRTPKTSWPAIFFNV
jgi:hypothetical protein